MPISLTKAYVKSEYEHELEASINSNLSSISANITTLSSNNTALNGLSTAVVNAGVFTLDLTTYRNFIATNADTAAKTLKITNVPTATDTIQNLNVKLTFSATATFTYTGTITWSIGTASSTLAPNPTAVGTFILNLKSFDAGTTWLGSYAGLY